MEDHVGYRFQPTDEEIVGAYVRPKNLESSTRHLNEVMNTVNINEFDPWELPCKSRIKSTDEVWYFFNRKVKKETERQRRQTKSGFWKRTGETKEISGKRRGRDEKIGEKRVFVFQSSGSEPKSDWVMHEYDPTFLHPDPPYHRTLPMIYTVCKVIFKGDPRDLSSSSTAASAGGEKEHVNNNSSGGQSTVGTEVVNHALQFSTGFLHLEEDARIEADTRRALDSLFSYGDWNSVFNNDEEEQGNTMFVQEDRNDYRPKMSLTGVFISDGDDDSDSDSATTSCSIKSSSTCVSFGSSNPPTDQIIYLPIKSVSLAQEGSKALVTNTVISEKKMSPSGDDARVSEIGGDHMGQEVVIESKRAGFVYRMIQRFTKKIKPCSCVSRI